MPCSLVEGYKPFGQTFCFCLQAEYEGGTLLQNTGNHLIGYMVPHSQNTKAFTLNRCFFIKRKNQFSFI
jgi:hypothetical protein